MVDHHERTRTIRNAPRKYSANKEEFLGLNAEGHIVGIEAAVKMLRKISDFCESSASGTRLLVRFTDGADCVPAGVDEAIVFLRKETQNLDEIDLYYAFSGLAGTYVVKNTTIAELSCRVKKDCFEISAHRMTDNSVDFSSLLESLKNTISHLPKKDSKLTIDSQKSATVISLALGLLCSLVVTAIPMLSQRGRDFYVHAIFLYLLLTIIMAAIIGFVIAVMIIVPLFNSAINGDKTDVLIGAKKTLGKNLKVLRFLDKYSLRLLIIGVIVLLVMPVLMIWQF